MNQFVCLVRFRNLMLVMLLGSNTLYSLHYFHQYPHDLHKKVDVLLMDKNTNATSLQPSIIASIKHAVNVTASKDSSKIQYLMAKMSFNKKKNNDACKT